MKTLFALLFLTACDPPDPNPPADATCAADSAVCSPAGSACLDSRTCCSGGTCSRFGRTCRVAQNLPLGEPCGGNAQCQSGLCDPARGACTATCSTDTACGSETVCARDASLGWACLPVCADDAGCAVYAPPGGGRLRCLFVTTRGGLAAGVCGP